MLYGERSVLPGLARLAREQLRADGISGEALCVVSGALDGIERVAAGAPAPGRRVAVENPGYAALYDLLRAHGLALEPVAVDDRGMLPERARGGTRARRERRRRSRRAGQNPTGAALDASARRSCARCSRPPRRRC